MTLGMSGDIAIIMPIDLRRRGKEIVNRFVRWAEAAERSHMRLLVGLAATSSINGSRLRAIGASRRNVDVIAVPSGAEVNLSILRNAAAQHVSSGTLLFADVDIHPEIGLFRALSEEVDHGAPLAMAPCLYLSKLGTRALLSGRPAEAFIEDFRSFNARHVMHLAMPSSVMAVRARDHHAIGGFHEGYCGHGFEDFDYMLRLMIDKNLLRTSANLLVDRPYRAPLLADGFRAALGALCLPNLLEEKVALHMFHERDNSEDYYLLRKKNAQQFQERFADVAVRFKTEEQVIPAMVVSFFVECAMREIDPTKWHALFDARPRHMLQRRSVLSRAWRTLRDRLSVNV